MNFKYVIEKEIKSEVDGVVDVKQNNIHGTVDILVPKYTQRLKYIQDCKFKTDDAGNIKVDMSSLDSVIKMVEISKKHVLNMDLLNEKSGRLYKNFDDLEDDAECDGVINEIAGLVLSGVKLGKN